MGLVITALAVGATYSCVGCNTAKTVVVEEKGSGGPEKTARVIAEAVSRSVQVFCTGLEKKSRGSGVIIKSAGTEALVASAEHVMSKDCMLTIVDTDGGVYLLYDLESNKENDLATAKFFTTKNYSELQIKTPTLGEPVFTVGWPLDKLKRKAWLTVTRGVVAAEYDWRYRITAPIWYGSSGGPVFNTRGELICIVSSMALYSDGTYYCAKASLIKDVGNGG